MLVAILAQNGHEIGLFEIFGILQHDGQLIHYVKSVGGTRRQWVLPSVELIRTVMSGSSSSEIRVMVGDGIRVDANMTVWAHQTFDATYSRLPYTVSFWDQSDIFPVYSMTPQYFLPWTTTIKSHVGTRPRRVRNTLPDDAVCAISLMPLTMNKAYWLPCGHAFSDVIFTALSSDERCPLCRRPTLPEDVHH